MAHVFYVVLITLASVGVLAWAFQRWGKLAARRAGYCMVRWGQEHRDGVLPQVMGSRAADVVAEIERDERQVQRQAQIAALATADDRGEYVILGQHPVGHRVLYASGDKAHMEQLCALKNDDAADGRTDWHYAVQAHHAPGTPWRPEASR